MVSWKKIIFICLDSGLDLSIFYSKFYTNLHFSFIPSDFLCFYKVACSFWIIGCRKITVSLYYVWRIHNIFRMVMLLWNLGGWWCWQMFYQYIFCLFFCLLTITDIRITGIIHYSYTSKAAQWSIPLAFQLLHEEETWRSWHFVCCSGCVENCHGKINYWTKIMWQTLNSSNS